MFSPEVFVLARGKQCKNCISAQITKRLNRAGVQAYRVTPNATPKYRPENVKLVINYGVSAVPTWWNRLPTDCVIKNNPVQVNVSSNKVLMTTAMREVFGDANILPSTESKEVAEQWLAQGDTVVTRTILSGHSGAGIVLSPPQVLPYARLYTKLIRRRGLREYRLYMYDGRFIDIVQKKRMSDGKLVRDGWCSADDVARWWTRTREVIRSYFNGWAFCHENLDVNDIELFEDIARQTANLINWGCVDLLIDSRTRQWYAIETNTAPGLDGETTFGTFIDMMVDTALEQGCSKQPYNQANYREY